MATVLSIGGVTVTGQAGLAGDYLFKIAAQFAAASLAGNLTEIDPPVIATVAGGLGSDSTNPILEPTIAAPAAGKLNVLVIPSTQTGWISVPSGYTDIVYNGPGTIIAGPGQVVVGDLEVRGGASTVIATSGAFVGTSTVFGTGSAVSINGSITDTTASALLSFVSGNYLATTSGNNSTVVVGNRGAVNAVINGNNSTVIVGDATTVPAQTRTNEVVVLHGTGATVNAAPLFFTNIAIGKTAAGAVVNVGNASAQAAPNPLDRVYVSAFAGGTINQFGGEVIGVASVAGALNYNGTGGTAFLYDYVGGAMINAGPHTEYVANPGIAVSTIIGSAGGADSVFAFSAVNYDGSKSASTFFMQSQALTAGVDTVVAGTNATVFGGGGGGVYTMGTGDFIFVPFSGAVGGNVQDTVCETATSGSATIGAAGGAPTHLLYSATGEQLTVATTGSGAVTEKLLMFAQGEGDTISAANAAGGNFFVMDNASAAGGAGSLPSAVTGNSTLIATNAGHDQFVDFVDGAGVPVAAHTITVENWQATDLFIVSNLNGAGAFSSADLATIAAFNAGTSNSFTLQDGTTVTFTNGGIPHNVVTN